jgi:hypothetical protein
LCALRCGGTVEKLNTLSTREIDFVHEISWLRNVQRQYSFVWSISIFFLTISVNIACIFTVPQTRNFEM